MSLASSIDNSVAREGSREIRLDAGLGLVRDLGELNLAVRTRRIREAAGMGLTTAVGGLSTDEPTAW